MLVKLKESSKFKNLYFDNYRIRLEYPVDIQDEEILRRLRIKYKDDVEVIDDKVEEVESIEEIIKELDENLEEEVTGEEESIEEDELIELEDLDKKDLLTKAEELGIEIHSKKIGKAKLIELIREVE